MIIKTKTIQFLVYPNNQVALDQNNNNQVSVYPNNQVALDQNNQVVCK